jgi:hypothetical protein
MGKQQIDHVAVPAEGDGEIERSGPSVRVRVNGSTAFKKRGCGGNLVLLGGEVQRSKAAIIEGCRINTGLQKRNDEFHIALERRIVEFGPSVAINAGAIMALWTSIAHTDASIFRLTHRG